MKIQKLIINNYYENFVRGVNSYLSKGWTVVGSVECFLDRGTERWAVLIECEAEVQKAPVSRPAESDRF